MQNLSNLPNKEKLRHNFSRCRNWEEIYLYIIELGAQLPPLPVSMRTPKHFVTGCQSKVWIGLETYAKDSFQFYGDSDTAIVKGLIAILFIIYQNLTLTEIISYDVQPFFNELELIQHLTPYRSQGLEAIVRNIRIQANAQKTIYQRI
ncbi:Cysteine desulfuration protein SufE [Candidatus Mikella endobia]|uniref:Cysteine desulfuration protein SufE n=1 Tax=Candidatus Mikella endobia TaxID=1778264 RepID=A0A143WQJ2_9ENTR|nr:cysteine desulfuration protein SufE [Candidatus Mikella endobia]CUX95998.1 Cysteine desulfuration protein SufE [Candidatus Mikella endobia]